MKDIKTMLKLQALWLAIAILFHVLSLVRVSLGMGPLSTNAPIYSIAALSLFIPVLLAGWRSHYLLYGVINGILICLVFYKGYLFQVLAIFSPERTSDYPSHGAWFAGILINTFGVPVGIYSSWLALKSIAKD